LAGSAPFSALSIFDGVDVPEVRFASREAGEWAPVPTIVVRPAPANNGKAGTVLA
jgi:hypothetical protein